MCKQSFIKCIVGTALLRKELPSELLRLQPRANDERRRLQQLASSRKHGVPDVGEACTNTSNNQHFP